MNNSRGRVKQRRLVAMEQVKARIKAAGAGAEGDKKVKGDTKEKKAQRLEQAKYELAILEKRV